MPEYVKDCDCANATASTSQVRTTTERNEHGWTITTAALIFGPSCDKCGRAWLRVWNSEGMHANAGGENTP